MPNGQTKTTPRNPEVATRNPETVRDLEYFEELDRRADRAQELWKQGQGTGLEEVKDVDEADETELNLDWNEKVSKQVEQLDEVAWNLTVLVAKSAAQKLTELQAQGLSREQIEVELGTYIKSLQDPNLISNLPETGNVKKALQVLQESFGVKGGSTIGQFLQNEWPGFLTTLAPEIVSFLMASETSEVPTPQDVQSTETSQPEPENFLDGLLEQGKTLFEKAKERPLLTLLLAGFAVLGVTKLLKGKKEGNLESQILGGAILIGLVLFGFIKMGDFEGFKKFITANYDRVKGLLGGGMLAAMIPESWRNTVEELQERKEELEQRLDRVRVGIDQVRESLSTKWTEHRDQVIRNFSFLENILPEDFDTLLVGSGVTLAAGTTLALVLRAFFTKSKLSLFGNVLRLGKSVLGSNLGKVALLGLIAGGLGAAFMMNRTEVQAIFKEYLENHPEGKNLWESLTVSVEKIKKNLDTTLEEAKERGLQSWQQISAAWGDFLRAAEINPPAWITDPAQAWLKIKESVQTRAANTDLTKIGAEALIGVGILGVLSALVVKNARLKPIIQVLTSPMAAKVSVTMIAGMLLREGQLRREAVIRFFDALQATGSALWNLVPPEQQEQLDTVVANAEKELSAFAILLGLEGEVYKFETPQEKEKFAGAFTKLTDLIKKNTQIDSEKRVLLEKTVQNISSALQGGKGLLFFSDFSFFLASLGEQPGIKLKVTDYRGKFVLKVNDIVFPPLAENPYPFLSTAREISEEMAESVVENLNVLQSKLNGRKNNVEDQQGVTAKNREAVVDQIKHIINYLDQLIPLVEEEGYKYYNEEAESKLIQLVRQVPGLYVKDTGQIERDFGMIWKDGKDESYIKILRSDVSHEQFRTERPYLDTHWYWDMSVRGTLEELTTDISLGFLDEILNKVEQTSEIYQQASLLKKAIAEKRDISSLGKEFWFAVFKDKKYELVLNEGMFCLLWGGKSVGEMIFIDPFTSLGRELKELVCPGGDADFERLIRESGVIPLSLSLSLGGVVVSVLRDSTWKTRLLRPFLWGSAPQRYILKALKLPLKASRILSNPATWMQMKRINIVDTIRHARHTAAEREIISYLRYEREILYWNHRSSAGSAYIGSKTRIKRIVEQQRKTGERLIKILESSDDTKRAVIKFVGERFGTSSDVYHYISGANVNGEELLRKFGESDEICQAIRQQDPKVIKSITQAYEATKNATRSIAQRVGRALPSVDILGLNSDVKYQDVLEMRKLQGDELIEYLKRLGAREDKIPELAEIISKSRKLNEIALALQQIGGLRVSEGVNGILRIARFAPPALVGVAFAGNVFDAYQSYARAREIETNPELRELIMQKGYVSSGIAVGELAIDVAMWTGRIVTKVALPLTVFLESTRYAYKGASEAREEVAMKAEDYEQKPRQELLHLWYTTGLDTSFGEAHDSAWTTSTREKYLEERTATRRKIITALLLKENTPTNSERFKYRMRYAEVVGRSEYDVTSFQEAQEVLVASSVFADCMENRARDGLTFRGVPIDLTDHRYDAERIEIKDIVIVMKVSAEENLREARSFFGARVWNRLKTISDSYINYSINIALGYFHLHPEFAEKNERLHLLVLHLMTYLNLERKKAFVADTTLKCSPSQLEGVQDMYFSATLTTPDVKRHQEIYAPSTADSMALYAVARYFGYIGACRIEDLRKFFSEETAQIHGIYWNGEGWKVNREYGRDEFCGKSGAEMIANMLRWIRYYPADVFGSRYDKLLDFRRKRDDVERRKKQALTIADILEKAYRPAGNEQALEKRAA